MTRILAIETSCDETAAAVLDNGKVLSNVVASQIKIHQKTGGVVPEVASRAHVEKILPVIKEALKKAEGIRGLKDIDLIAVTIGPGLIGSLLVGVETAKALAYSLDKPIIGVNHLEGHIYANFIGKKVCHSCESRNLSIDPSLRWDDRKIKLPAVILTASGGHTSLILMKDIHNYKVIGETLDDAAGEAFDKVAQILGLGYPGGPAIEKAAHRCHSERRRGISSLANRRCEADSDKLRDPSPMRYEIISRGQDDSNIKFPRPMLDKDDFSFSGLKTSVLYRVMKLKRAVTRSDSLAPSKTGLRVAHGYSLSDKELQSSNNRKTTEQLPNHLQSKIAFEFQNAIAETLVTKTLRAAEKYKVKSILLSGGVAANKFLRSEMKKAIKNYCSRERSESRTGFSTSSKNNQKINFFVPPFEYCTDNAAMIGAAAYIKSQKILDQLPSGNLGAGRASKKPRDWSQIEAEANLNL